MRYSPQDYEREVKEFVWNIPPDYNIVDVVEGHAKKDPKRVAVFWEDAEKRTRCLSFGELAEGARRFGGALQKLGVRKNDPILHVLPRVPEAYVAQLGTFCAGAVAVPCSEMLKPKEIAYRALASGAKVIVADPSTAAAVEEARTGTPLSTFVLIGEAQRGWQSFASLLEQGSTKSPKVRVVADDPMTINFTSGTTGNPKPVVHKHHWMYCHHRVTARYWWDAAEDDILWATTAPGWAKWYWSPVGVGLTTGASQLLYNGRFEAERYLELLQSYRITKLCATPTEYRLFAQFPDMARYRLVLKDALSAGEPLNVEPIEAFKRAFGVTIRDGYGQTESVCLVCNYPGIDVKPGAMGKPTPGPGATLIDEKGDPVQRGELGEIAVPPGTRPSSTGTGTRLSSTGRRSPRAGTVQETWHGWTWTATSSSKVGPTTSS